jgi:outer membrane lipoprotein SlyB
MKKVFLIITLLATGAFLAGCNKTETNTNAVVNAKTPVPVANLASGTDPELKKKIEENWAKVGCTGAVVEVKEGVAILRGTIPKGKMQDCVRAAQEAKPGKFENNLVEAK